MRSHVLCAGSCEQGKGQGGLTKHRRGELSSPPAESTDELDLDVEEKATTRNKSQHGKHTGRHPTQTLGVKEGFLEEVTCHVRKREWV